MPECRGSEPPARVAQSLSQERHLWRIAHGSAVYESDEHFLAVFARSALALVVVGLSAASPLAPGWGSAQLRLWLGPHRSP